MPALTYDGRSFMLDGRRLWLVAGSLSYSRVPRDLWKARLLEAKQAGLNTIETTVFWHRHEPRAGHFDFKGEQDLRHFVELIGQLGLYCILRPGPYVGEEADAGGLPAWLLATPGIVPRKASGPFLEACSRYLSAVVDRVRDLQATSPKGGPIVLVQNEAHWTCGDDKTGSAYLGELNRYLREAGVTVPIINTNSLWQSVEGEIDCWSGSGDMLPSVRQLGVVRPDQPRLVELRVGSPVFHGKPDPEPTEPRLVQHRLAQILAAGGQFILNAFHAGSFFAFWAGRTLDAPDAFVAKPRDEAPLAETGRRGPLYGPARRLCMFASRFGRVLANLDPGYQPLVSAPAASETVGPAVVHASGTQGGVAFVFGRATDKTPTVPVLLPDGTALTIPLARHPSQAVAWCLFGVSLGGRTTLDYSNLSVFTLLGRVLVCFGPAGADAHLSIGGAPLEAVVPSGREPFIVEHEGMTVVICNEEQVDHVYESDEALYIGVDGLGADGKPIALPHSRHAMQITSGGAQAPVTPAPSTARGAPARITPTKWECADTGEYAAGTSARYAAIAGPAELAQLGSPYGLGWYRVKFKAPSGGRAVLAFPGAGDRLHAFIDGEPAGVVGSGPGAEPDLAVTLKRAPQTLVILAENAGRVSAGSNLGEPRGLLTHIWQTKPLRSGRPALRTGEPLDILAFRTPLWEIHAGDLASPQRITWTVRHAHKAPIMVTFRDFVARGILIVNNRPVRFLERGSADRLLLETDWLSRGVNTIQVALVQEPGPDGAAFDPEALLGAFAKSVGFAECVENMTEGAEWAFARWEPPTGSHFHAPGARRPHGPVWWRAAFTPAATDAPLLFEPSGLTKGQVYVNGRHIGRYLAATPKGRALPHRPLYIPRPWLTPEAENALLIFDEHGGDPARSRLTYGEG